MKEGGDLKVRGGRHPLQELSVNQFIDNDTKIGGDSAKLQLITGPNSSGKSVYLKQVLNFQQTGMSLTTIPGWCDSLPRPSGLLGSRQGGANTSH